MTTVHQPGSDMIPPGAVPRCPKIDFVSIKNAKVAKRVPNFIIRYLTKIIHQDEINDALAKFGDTQGVDFAENALDYINVKYTAHNLDKIPNAGKYVFVSNHPLGGLDGLILIAAIGRKFGSIHTITNDLLMAIQPLNTVLVPVNKFGSMQKDHAARVNDAYASETPMLTFPAGLCSRKLDGVVKDLEWKKSFIKKAVQYDRQVVPVYFDAKNSNFFYRLAQIRSILKIRFNVELLYLPDEMFKQKNATFDLYFGEPISASTFTKDKTPGEWTEYVRSICYNLKPAKQDDTNETHR